MEKNNEQNWLNLSKEQIRMTKELQKEFAEETLKNMVEFAKNHNGGLEQYFIEQLKEVEKEGIEIGHLFADNILCELLSDLGYTKLVDVYKSIEKMYG